MPDKDASLMARCPECDSRIYFERRPDAGQIIVCPECEHSLEVIRTNPIRLDWAEDQGERVGASGDFTMENPFADFDDEDDDGGYDDEDEDY